MLPVDKEQLFSEKTFIEYCEFDYHRHHKLNNINSSFLRAAEADGFLKPLLQIEEDITLEDGSHKLMPVNYYSPHQILIIAALSKNQVHEGLLWEDLENLDYYKQHRFRMVNWGHSGYAFNITLAKQPVGTRKPSGINHISWCTDFQSFLSLLHSLKQQQHSISGDRNKDRYFSAAPSLHFDFSPLKKDGADILKRYGLDLVKLKVLSEQVARIAGNIDPLEHWYYYINLHPQWRKDLFKGDAALAQELYRIYDLLSELAEAVSGEKTPPMFELLYGQQNIHPYLIPRVEYVHGTDVKSMWVAIQKFKDWSKQEENKGFVDGNTLTSLGKFEKELKEYENKYGARSFISNGIREVGVEKNIKIEDLDLKTKQYVDQIVRQAKTRSVDNEHQFISLWGDELEEKVKNKEITPEHAREEDYDLFIKQEIFDAIEHRLSSLKRELWSIFDIVQKQIAKKVNEAWDIEHNFGNYFWQKRNAELIILPRDKQHELYEVEHEKVSKEALYWSKKRDEYGEAEYTMDLLFCSKCREKPVAIHQSHNDEKISNNSICDDCIKNIKDPKTIKGAELKCDYCGSMLYKYAYLNRLNDLLFNKAPADIDVELEYGRLKIQIRCKNCKQENRRFIDWGWTA